MLTVCSGTVNWEMLTGYQKQIMSHHLTRDLHGTKENVCILLNSLPLNALNVE